eukprot:352040-Chlamydomonas_euryale.AAC.2
MVMSNAAERPCPKWPKGLQGARSKVLRCARLKGRRQFSTTRNIGSSRPESSSRKASYGHSVRRQTLGSFSRLSSPDSMPDSTPNSTPTGHLPCRHSVGH